MKTSSVRRFLDLKATIAIFTVALFVSTIWALAHNLDKRVRVNFKEVLASQQFQTVEHVARSLDEAVRLRVSALADTASLVSPDLMTRPDRLHGFLAERMPLERFFNTGLFVVSREGIGLADLPNLEGREGAGHAEMDYFSEVMASGKPVVGKPVMSQFTKKPVINIAVPIKNGKNEVVGVLVGGNQITGSNFLSEVLPSKLQMDGDLHIISEKNGIYVSSTDPSRIMQPAPPAGINTMYDRYRQGYEGSGIAVDSQGVESLISAKRVASTGWLVVATLPTALAFKPLESLQREIYKDAGLASVIIALLLWLFLHSQISPLGRSAQTIDAMTAGREPLRPLPREGGKEIRLLIDSFNKLQEHIKQQQKSLQAREEQIQVAASVFEGTSEAILISSADNVIVSVNRAFCKMTGYAENELVGQNPRLLQSGRHGLAFYKEMWSSLQNAGQWQGEIWNRRKNGEIYPERITISVLYDEAGKVLRHIAIAADITSRKKAEDEINSLAFYDPLTDLPNRRLLLNRLKQAMASSARSKNHGALLFIDLDNFKTLNDTLGHDIGDLLLQQVAERLSTCVREGDTVARLGGDEFVLMLEDLSTNALEAATQAETVGEKILATLNQPYQLAAYVHHSTPSIGIALFTNHQETIDELMKRADLAMYQAKAAGRNNLRFFDPEMQAVIMTRVALESDLREGVLKGQFILHYQAQVAGEGRITGVEVLLRWEHPSRGLVSPLEFITLTEDTGLILKLGQWVLKTACVQLATWAARSEMAHLSIAVNVSARQFHHRDFVNQVLEILDQTGANPQLLKLELTESLLVHDIEDIIAKMTVLKAKGVSFSLDDFGTGYSSLSYLKRLPLDQLKIDQSFVRDILTDPNDAAIAKMVVSLAESMGLTVIAEGVETEAQRDFLERQGCHVYQGYLFSHPLPLNEFEAFVKQA
ncbi:MAG: EAL domain-containing protein [Rhodocyclales bacterium]|nr:EAL domain-containing protein [Rhodocyclales bacterium]